MITQPSPRSQFSKMAACPSSSFSVTLSRNPTFTSTTSNPDPSLFLSSPSYVKFSSISPVPILRSFISRAPRPLSLAHAAPSTTNTNSAATFHGLCYVVGDNIDTDQIIPAEYLTLVPSNPDEYEQIGSYALIGLPDSYKTRFIEPKQTKTKYSIVIAGNNFGCGSSREHAPVALGASGLEAVVAQSYARIFFRNSVATGEVYPLETELRVCEECKTGDLVTVEMSESKLINHTTGKEYNLKPIGDAGPVIEAGGIFAFARKTGMIPSQSPA